MAASSSSNFKKPKSHRCSVCSRTFDSVEELNAHQKMEHGTSSHPPAGVG
jgi:hypothetical protein